MLQPPASPFASSRRRLGALGVSLRRYREAAEGVGTAFFLQAALVVSGVLVARVLGVENRGQLALLVLMPVLFSQLGTLGLPLATTYFIARQPQAAGAVFGRAAAAIGGLLLLLMLLQALVLVLVLRHATPQAAIAAFATVLALPGCVGQQLGLAVLQGRQRFAEFNVCRSLQVVIYSAAAALIFLSGEGGLVAVTLAWCGSTAVAGTITLRLATRGLAATSAPLDAPGLAPLLGFGIRSLPAGVSPTESFRLDQVAVGVLAGPAALGLYVVGLAFTNLPRFVAQSIGMVAYPKVASDSGSAGATTLSYALAGVAACGAIVVCLEAAAGRMVPFFFGAEFAGAVPITRVLLLAAAFSSLRRVLNDCARGLGRPDLGARAEVVSWFVLVPLVAALGPELGGLGIAWALAATAITGAGILALLLAWSRRGPVGALSEATT